MNRKECLKIMVRCVAFVVVFSMLFGNATDLLMRHDDESNEIHAFYSEPKDTIDVLYVGSSPLLRGVSPMVMWQEHGFTGYVRASALQAPSVSYGLLAESLKYQNPELVVLLCDNIFSDYDYAEREGDLRRGLDGMKMSKYKLDIIKEVTAADESQSMLSYAFPLMRYHDRWKEINLAEDNAGAPAGASYSLKKGKLIDLREMRRRPTPKTSWSRQGKLPPLTRAQRTILKNPSRFARKKNIPVLLLHLPKMSWTYAQSEALEGFCCGAGCNLSGSGQSGIQRTAWLRPAG